MTRSVSKRRPRLAKRKADPTWIHPVDYIYTFGPEVADIATLAGLEPDENQQLILDQTFGYLPDGRPAAFEVDIIAARQNIKTAAIIMIELGWLYVTEEPLIVHSAHELDATEEAFIDLRARIEETPKLAKFLDPTKGEKDHPGIFTGNGSWEVHLLGGLRLKYKARTKNAGRALTADKLVLDEGFAVQASMVGSLYPTLTTIFDCQVVTASSAGKLDSVELRDHRTRGRAGTSPRQFYVEWGDRNAWKGCKDKHCDHSKIAVGCALDDETRWAKIMPAWGTRVFPETIRAMRQSMPPLEFAREFMVWWEDPPNLDAGGVLNLERWKQLVNVQEKKPKRACVFLAVAPNRKKASIGVAGTVEVLDKDGTAHDRTLVMARTQPRWEWVVPALEKMIGKQDIAEVALHPGGQAQLLIPALRDREIEFESIATQDLGRSTASFIEGVNETDPSPFVHLGQPELDDAVRTAITRYSASGEVEIWDQRDRTVDITALYAASGAADRWAMQDDYDVMDSFL